MTSVQLTNNSSYDVNNISLKRDFIWSVEMETQ